MSTEAENGSYVEKLDLDKITNFRKIINKYIIHLCAFSFVYNILLFASPIYMLQIYNRIIPTKSEEALLWLTALVLVLFLFMSFLDSVRNLLLIHLSRNVKFEFGQKALEHQLIFGGTIGQNDQEKWNSVNDVDKVSEFITKKHIINFLDSLWFPIFVVGLGILHPLFSVIVVFGAIWLGLLAVVGHKLILRANIDRQIQASGRDIGTDEILGNIELVISLGMVRNVVRRWNRGHRKSFDEQLRINERLAIVASAGRASRLLIQSLALGLGAFLAINDAVSPGAIIASSILIGRALAPIEGLIMAWNGMKGAGRSYSRLLSLDSLDQNLDGHLMLSDDNNGLEIDRLTFVDNRKMVFRNLSLSVRPGMMVAIVGPSGAGKSALVKHLVGLRRGTEGTVRIDGLDVATLSNQLRLQCIGYKPQEDTELTGTIVDHIGRFGAFEAEDILLASRITNANEMILKLPDGYSTKLGTNGYYLSAGQRQCLNLTRAICGLPPLVVLDEPTANLDEAGERSLHRTLDEVRLHGSVLCVATNKTSLIRRSEIVVVFNHRGELCIGRPDEIFDVKLRAVPKVDERIG